MSTRVGRDYRFRQVRERVLAGAQTCAICGKALDFDAPPRSRWAPSVDHVLPVSHTAALPEYLQERLALDPEGLRAVHVSCNSRRGAGRVRPRHTSRSW